MYQEDFNMSIIKLVQELNYHDVESTDEVRDIASRHELGVSRELNTPGYSYVLISDCESNLDWIRIDPVELIWEYEAPSMQELKEFGCDSFNTIRVGQYGII